ncbi:F0F1 ATP synthase subunit B [Rhizobium alvei]|uniref:ATP synthase subunit b n=1 Tax=Rhizobium alvei TaxID=1132659 RepID=A0ABT8YHA2_9HYPH|nr:F0F1 ATP synthase subunit B [Rhizobium alvei]MDO6962635.1 F0F1 ATP synthase subunit B [Rhizobium alvei]
MFVTMAYALSTTAVVSESADAQEAAATDAHAAQTTHSETGAEHGAFPPFDPSSYPSQLLWLAITFGIFYYLISKIIAPRIASTLETRESRIAADLAEANRAKSEADAVVAKYEQELATARSKASAIAAEARDESKAKADAERASLEADLAKKIAAAEERIASIKSSALADVGKVAEETAVEIVESLTGISVSAADSAAAVNSVKG